MPYHQGDGAFRNSTSSANAFIVLENTEDQFVRVYAYTICPTSQTLTSQSGGTMTTTAGTGPIVPMTLLHTHTVGGYKGQVWYRDGTAVGAPSIHYYRWNFSSALTSGTYVAATTHAFFGCEEFYWAVKEWTGGPPETMPIIPEIDGPGWDFDLGGSVYARISASPVGTSPVIADPFINETNAGQYGGTGISRVIVSAVAGFPGVGGIDPPVGGYAITHPSATWEHGMAFMVAGIDYHPVTPPSGGWHVGRFAAGGAW